MRHSAGKDVFPSRVFERIRYVRENENERTGSRAAATSQGFGANASQRAHEKHQRTEAPERKPSQASPVQVTRAKASHASTPSQVKLAPASGKRSFASES
jgi:hypothetical protein